MAVEESCSYNKTLDKNTIESMRRFFPMSALLTLMGISVNLLSLSYFLTQGKSNIRLSATQALNKKLFIFLNSLDILVCISLIGMLLSLSLNGRFSELSFQIPKTIFIVTVLCTGFITSLLALIRAISIIWPHHHFKIKLINAASLCFGLVMIIVEALPHVLSAHDNDKLVVEMVATSVTLVAMFFIVICSNIVCMKRLASSQITPWKREATITIGILSVLYCTLNVGFLVVFGFHTFMCPTEEDLFCTHPVFETICLYVLLPLNSACNPIVYFVRNPEMRRYLTNRGRRITGPSTIRNTEMEVDMESKEGQHVTTTVVQDGDDN